jgi:hypothetical protein
MLDEFPAHYRGQVGAGAVPRHPLSISLISCPSFNPTKRGSDTTKPIIIGEGWEQVETKFRRSSANPSIRQIPVQTSTNI